MILRKLLILTIITVVSQGVASAGVINVPGDYPSIESAVDRVAAGDTIIIAPGVYKLNLTISDKAVTLASRFITTGDTSYVHRTVLDGANETVLNVGAGGADTKVIGLTVRNGDDGIMAACRMLIADCFFVANGDAIDYEGGGGVCRNNSFTGNHDDAIDLDGPVAVLIVGNRIWNNNDDGIEIRLHPYTGPVLEIMILGNTIHANREDGIQFIDYSTDSDRKFIIERNIISHNAMAALSCMGNENTVENYEAFPVPEEIVLLNNTIIHNNYGVTGGARLAAVNNLIVSTTHAAAKGIAAKSLIANNLFWDNGRDLDGCTARRENNLYADPLLTAGYRLSAGSPAVDAGADRVEWNGQRLQSELASDVNGKSVDIGAIER
jgi:Right handed beta helix region